MGVEDTSYQIPDLNANTTFYDWVVKENDEIIEKLNLLKVYGVAGSTGIDIVSELVVLQHFLLQTQFPELPFLVL